MTTAEDQIIALTAERDYWRAMYEAMRAAARAGLAARTNDQEDR